MASLHSNEDQQSFDEMLKSPIPVVNFCFIWMFADIISTLIIKHEYGVPSIVSIVIFIVAFLYLILNRNIRLQHAKLMMRSAKIDVYLLTPIFVFAVLLQVIEGYGSAKLYVLSGFIFIGMVGFISLFYYLGNRIVKQSY